MSQAEEPTFLKKLFQGAYYLLVFGFVATVGYSATMGAFTSQDPAPAEEATPMSADSSAGRLCQIELAALHARVYSDALPFFQRADVKAMPTEWDEHSKRWRAELERLKKRCQLGKSRSMDAVSKYAKDIERTQVAMATALRAFRNLADKPLKRIRAFHESSPDLPTIEGP